MGLRLVQPTMRLGLRGVGVLLLAAMPCFLSVKSDIDSTPEVWDEAATLQPRLDYTNHALVRFVVTSAKEKRAFDMAVRKHGLDIWTHKPNHHAVVRVPPTVSLEQFPLQHTILHPNIELLMANERIASGHGFHDKFHSAKEINGFLKDLTKKYPKVLSLHHIGSSVKGTAIMAVHVHAADTKEAPVVFVQAGQHAREWIGPAAALGMLDTLAEEASRHGGLPGWQLTLVPLANPDGYQYSMDSDRMWRKNRDKNKPSAKEGMLLATSTDEQCVGVDQNRNWGPEWGKTSNHGQVTRDQKDQCSETYIGSNAMTEPEVAAIAKHAKSQHVIAFLDVHSYSQKLLPAGCNGFEVARKDAQEQNRVGNLMIEAMGKAAGATYQFGPCPAEMYLCSGTAGDWGYHSLGVVHSYSLELRPSDTQELVQLSDAATGSGFVISPSQIKPTTKDLLAGVVTMAKEAMKGASK